MDPIMQPSTVNVSQGNLSGRLDHAVRDGTVTDRLHAGVDTSQPVDPTEPDVTRTLAGMVADMLPGWRFGWDRARKRAGATDHGTGRITISAPIFSLSTATWADLAQTLAHEIAHGITGPQHHHDRVWRHTITALGGSPARTHSIATPAGTWTGSCPNGHTHTRHRRPKTGVQQSCGRCSRTFHPEFLITWTHTGQTT